MKYSRIIIVSLILSLLLNIGVDVAEAACTGTTTFSGGHTHSLTVSGSSTTTFSVGKPVTDTVSSSVTDGVYMDFSWKRPNGSSAQDKTIAKAGGYTDTFTVDSNGDWTIYVKECNSSNVTLAVSSISFPVTIEAPEFSKFGAFFPIFAAGLIYVNMRKKTIKK